MNKSTLNPKQKASFKKKWHFQSLVVTRAFLDIPALKDRDAQSLMMDLDSVPDLDLEGLYEADAFDFVHDICGIIRHMDRSNYPGTLKNCFVPRYCR